jgi:hypothetical protein
MWIEFLIAMMSGLFIWSLFYCAYNDFTREELKTKSYENDEGDWDELLTRTSNPLYSPRVYVPPGQGSWGEPWDEYSPHPALLSDDDTRTFNDLNPFGRTGLYGNGIFPHSGKNFVTVGVFLSDIDTPCPRVLLNAKYNSLPGDMELSSNYFLFKDVECMFQSKEDIKEAREAAETIMNGPVDHCANTDTAWLHAHVLLVACNSSVKTAKNDKFRWVELEACIEDVYKFIDDRDLLSVCLMKVYEIYAQDYTFKSIKMD